MRHTITIILILLINIYRITAQTISTQGVLRDPSGKAATDGNYNMVFTIYDAETGGTQLWTETLTNVEVKNGVYSVTLGLTNPLDFESTESLWVGINIENEGELSRVRLSISPYEQFIISGAENVFPGAGKAGIGTDSPDKELSVIGVVRGANAADESEYTEIGHEGSHGYINTFGDGNLDFRHDGNTKMSLTEDGDLNVDGTLSTSDGNSENWHQAYEWGNHAEAGYVSTSDDGDADPGNELQTISIDGHNITLSNDGGTVTVPDDDQPDSDAEVPDDITVGAGGSVSNAALDADLQDLADGSLSGSKVGSGIDGDNITDGSIDDSELANNAVTSVKIKDEEIVNTDISGSAAISTSKLSGAVTNITDHGLGDLAALDAVGSSEIADDAVGAAALDETASLTMAGIRVDNGTAAFVDDSFTSTTIPATRLYVKSGNEGAVSTVVIDSDGDTSDSDKALVIRSKESADDADGFDNSDTKFVVMGGGNVGINLGASIPSTALDVNGTVTATSFVGDGSQITNLPTSADNLGNHTATENINLNGHYLSGDQNDEGIFVDDGGQVGIGTASPYNLLDVRGNISFGNSANTWQLDYNSWTGGHSDQANIRYNGSSGVSSFGFHGTGNKEANVIIDGAIRAGTNGEAQNSYILNGKFGIGTASPTEKLDVFGASASIVLGNIDSGEPAMKLWGSHGTGYAYIQAGGGTTSPKLRIAKFQTTTDPLDDFQIYSDQTYLSGKVGIGTASPSSKLEINGWIGRTAHNNGALVGSYNNLGNNSYKTNPIYIIGSSYKPNDADLGNMYGIGYTHTNSTFITDPGPNTWGMYVAGDGDVRTWLAASDGGSSYFTAGNVGIGTTSPTSLLNIKGTGGNTSGLEFENAHDKVNMYFPSNNDNSDFQITYLGTGESEINLQADGDVILNGYSGNVGIATTSPTEKLEVNGTVKATAFMGDGSQLTGISAGVWDESNGEANYPGNVGIGTTSPGSYKLNVNGNTFSNRFYGSVTSSGNGDSNQPYKLSSDYSSWATIFGPSWTNSNGWGLFWAGNSGAKYGTNGAGGPGNIWGNSSNPNEFVIVGAGQTKWSAHLNSGNTWQAGNHLVAGSVGIGTTSPASKLHVDEGRIDITASGATGGGQNRFNGLYSPAEQSYRRSQLVLSSGYSDLVIASSQSNNNHGSTLTFASYNPSNAGDYRKFVINQGNWGSRKHMLDFGYKDAAYPNPHSYINSTETVLTLDGVNKRVGIGSISPTNKLDVNGTIKANTIKTDAMYDRDGNFLFQKGSLGTLLKTLNLSTDTSNDILTADLNPVGITWGQRTDNNAYYMMYPRKYVRSGGASSGNINRLQIAWHGGIDIGGSSYYGGTRFYNNSPYVGNNLATELFSIGRNNDNNVRVNYELYVGGWVRQNSGNKGIYWDSGSTYPGWHLYPASNNDFHLRSPGSESNIKFTRSGNAVNAYLYTNADWSGWLNNARQWQLRTRNDDGYSPSLYFREEGNETWTGNPGSDEGKIEYHSNRFYIASGSNSSEVVRFRRSGSDVAFIQNDGDMYAPRFSDFNDGNYYVDPNGTSKMNYIDANRVGVYSDNELVVFGGEWSSNGRFDGHLTRRNGQAQMFVDDWLYFSDSNNGNEQRLRVNVDNQYFYGYLTGPSDRRWKENIRPMESVISKLMRLQPTVYDHIKGEMLWVESEEDKISGKDNNLNFDRRGFIAQEIAEVFPSVVMIDPDGFHYVSDKPLTAISIKAVQELKIEKDEEISSLKADIEILKQEIQNLKNQ